MIHFGHSGFNAKPQIILLFNPPQPPISLPAVVLLTAGTRVLHFFPRRCTARQQQTHLALCFHA